MAREVIRVVQWVRFAAQVAVMVVLRLVFDVLCSKKALEVLGGRFSVWLLEGKVRWAYL